MNCETKNGTRRNRYNNRTKPVFLPHFGTIVNEILNAPINEILKEEPKRTSIPAVNIWETDDRFELNLAIPGFSKEDIKIALENDQLVISADTTAGKDTTYKLREFNYDNFSRTFKLPKSVDQSNISANMEDGILIVSLYKKEEQKARTIDIK